MCLEETVSMFVDACVFKPESFTAADVIDDVVKEVENESVWAGGVIGTQKETADYSEVRIWLRSVERRFSVRSGKKLYCMAERAGSEHMVKVEIIRASRIWQQQLAKKAPMVGRTMSKAR